MWLKEVELESASVKLLPLRTSHADALIDAASDGNLWELWFTSVPTKHTINDYIADALNQQAMGLSLPFVVIDKVSNKVIGSTRLCNADLVNHRVEIGYTWYAKRFQRSSVNTECKYLLLTHVFENLAAIAVELRTHWHNQVSRAAIARLGAKQDGVLRNHQRISDGVYRDTVIFSIINLEWPTVKIGLQHKLQSYC